MSVATACSGRENAACKRRGIEGFSCDVPPSPSENESCLDRIAKTPPVLENPKKGRGGRPSVVWQVAAQ
jgi:hypothetical protein